MKCIANQPLASSLRGQSDVWGYHKFITIVNDHHHLCHQNLNLNHHHDCNEHQNHHHHCNDNQLTGDIARPVAGLQVVAVHQAAWKPLLTMTKKSNMCRNLQAWSFWFVEMANFCDWLDFFLSTCTRLEERTTKDADVVEAGEFIMNVRQWVILMQPMFCLLGRHTYIVVGGCSWIMQEERRAAEY